MMHPKRRLLVVGLNPPETSGSRTLARVEVARQLLGYAAVDVRNLFAYPTRSSLDIGVAGSEQDGWLKARADLSHGLAKADGVLLGYGTQAPAGPARGHFHAQVSWLEGVLASAKVPVWLVGGAPRHPSRWQRYTHRIAPDRPFTDGLRDALELRAQRPT